jgi:OFA family oxalate/formate antiporter-like MFS transporter
MKGEKIMETGVKRWPYLLIGSIVFLCIGIIYAWSMFAVILKADFQSWTSADLASTFTIIMALFCLGNFVAGFILQKLSSKATLLICALLMAAAFIGFSMVQENTLWLLYLSYGGVGGFAVGITYNVVVSTVTKWFPEKVGAVSGTLMMSFAFSTLFLGMGAVALANVMSWRIVFFGIAIIMAVVIGLAAFILKLPGSDVVLPQRKVDEKSGDEQTVDMTVMEMVKSSPFWLFFCWGLLMLICVYGVMGNIAQCVLEMDEKATTMAAFSVTLLSIFNGLGRLVLGSLYDKFGRKKTMTIDTFLLILSSISILAAFKTGLLPLMVLGAMLTGFSYGGVPPTSAAFAADFFGVSNFPLKFGIINLFIFIGAFGSTFAGIIKDTAGSFQNLFYILIVLGIITLILNLLIKKKEA